MNELLEKQEIEEYKSPMDKLGISVKTNNKGQDSVIITKVVIYYTKKNGEEDTAALHGFELEFFENQILEIKPNFMRFKKLRGE